MTDAIIKFPGPVKASSKASSREEFLKKFQSLVEQDPPATTKAVDVYETMEILAIPQGINQKPDIATATQRNPRWGVTLAMSVMPDIDKTSTGPMMLPKSSNQFFAADDLDQIKDRIIFEVEKMIEIAKLAHSDPEGYGEYEQRALQARMAAFAKQGR
jgi:hypothetical protein